MKNRKIWSWMLRSFKQWLPALGLLVFCYIASALLAVGFAWGSKAVIDAATATVKDDYAFLYASIRQGILILAIILNSTLINHLKERLTAVMDRDWKKRILNQLLHGEYAKVSAFHTGELLNRINNDVRVLISSLLSILPSLASMVTKLVAAVCVLFTMQPQLTVVVLIGGVILVVATSLLRRKLKDLNLQASQAQGKVSGFIQEVLEKLLMVQAMDISEVVEQRSDQLLAERYRIHKKRKNISVLTSTCTTIVSYGLSFGTLIWCSFCIFKGIGGMTFGDMTAISQLVSQLQGPMFNMAAITPQYAAMLAAAERLMELEQTCETEQVTRKDGDVIYAQMTGISAENLTFAYDRDYIFDHVSFVLPKGSFGVIVGHSGIGKSTLLKLLLGVFPPETGGLYAKTEQGSVRIDKSTRSLFAYVPQGNLLLSGTLRENLLVTNPNATPEQIRQAVYISAMDDYLSTLPEGLETVLGENAQGLSEGQAQRLSIARAILSDAPILLLDEATSALDDETEKTVLGRICQLPGKTCIAVTHRPAATELADWSLVMGEQCGVRFRNKQ